MATDKPFDTIFKRYHVREVPVEFLPDGAPKVKLRFCQLNKRKMAQAERDEIFEAIEAAELISSQLSQESRDAQIRRQEKAPFPEAKPDAKPDANTFDDYSDRTLIKLAHVEHHGGDGWVELTDNEIDELICDEWLAGQIYDVSRPSSAKEREGNS